MTDIQTQTDHDRVVTSGAGLGAMAGIALMCAADSLIPHWCAFVVNWAVILSACGAITVYKRRWYGWLAFWGLAAICLTSAVMALFGVQRSLLGGAVAGIVITGIYYWLVRMPRLQEEPAERREVHVFHHVIHHGQEPGWTVTAAAAAPARKVIPGSVLRAITAPRKAASLISAARSERR